MVEILTAPEVEKLEIHDSPIKLNGDIPESQLYWHELTEEQKEMIQDKKEYYVFAVIYGVPEEDKDILDSCYGPRAQCLMPYLTKQAQWGHVAADLMKKNNGIENPERSPEFLDFLLNSLCIDYRLYVLASNPGVLELTRDITDEKVSIIRKFCVSLRKAKIKLEKIVG